MIKDFLKKITGVAKLEKAREEAEQIKKEADEALMLAEKATADAKEAEELSKLSEKDRATRKKEPWVGVLNTHVNKDNVRNGFFELDWNEPFVLKLKQEGYGVDGDADEEIVDRWFRELCANVVVDGDYGGPINTGVLDINEVKRKNQA